MIYHYNCHIQIPSRIYGDDISMPESSSGTHLDTFKDIWGPPSLDQALVDFVI